MDLLLIVLTILVSAILLIRFTPSDTYEMHETRAVGVVQAEEQMPDVAETGVRAGAPVRFLMYNVENYNVDKDVQRSRYNRRIKPIAEREAVAGVISGVRPQVVGLVEIGGEAALEDLATRLEARGLHYPYRTTLTRWGEDRALGILSMHPIVQDRSQAEYPLIGQTNRKMLRGILDVTIRTEDKREFRIMGVHLKSRVSDDPRAAEALRAREARTIAAHVEQAMKTQPHMPILVYGDWNDGPNDPALSVVTRGSSKARSLKRLNPKDNRGETWTIYFKQGDEYNVFDQIYVNSVLHRRMGRKSEMGVAGDDAEQQRKASDHRPVWCDMR